MTYVTPNDVCGLIHIAFCLVSTIIMIHWFVDFYRLRKDPLFVKRQSNISIILCIGCILGQMFDHASWAIYYSKFSFLPSIVSDVGFWIATVTYPWFVYGIAISFLVRYVFQISHYD